MTAPPPPLPKIPTGPFDLIVRLLQAIRLEVLKLADDPMGRELHTAHIERAFKDAVAAIKFAAPHSSCPFGPGCTKDSCKACAGSGWITKPVHDALPKELRREQG